MSALTELIDQFSVDNMNVVEPRTETLGKDDFLKLLVMQLKYQDPLEPMKNEDFIAQLATFNSLEQMINLNESFELLLSLQQMTQASSLIGKQVVYYDSDGERHEGTVDLVELYGGIPLLNVDGTTIPIDSVAEISIPSA